MGIGTATSNVLERLLQVNEIRLVRIYTYCAGATTEVVFDILVRGTIVGRVTTSPDELALPTTYYEALRAVTAGDEPSDSDRPAPFKIPDYVLTALEYMLVHDAIERTPVWLSFDLPIGYLPLIPWEFLLQPVLKVPVLRLPPSVLKPLLPRLSLDIALCLARTVSPQDIGDVAQHLHRALAPSLGRYCRLWIFGDRSVYPVLNQVKARYETATLQIMVPDPGKAPDYQEARLKGSTRLENPWLIWMCHAMGGTSADLAYFVADGSLAEPQSYMVFPPSVLTNVDPDWCRFVTVDECSAFVTEIGATSVGFNTPPDAHGTAALRLFQEHLARLRPGPSFLHSAAAGAGLADLIRALQFLYFSGDGPPPASSVVTLFCHPSGTERSLVAGALRAVPEQFRKRVASLATSQVAQRGLNYLLGLTPGIRRGLDIVAQSDEMGAVLERFTIAAKASARLLNVDDKPAWLARTQRTLEVAASMLYEADARGEVREGLEDALKTVASIADTHATDQVKKDL